jgi:CheY-like chemotaxis protein
LVERPPGHSDRVLIVEDDDETRNGVGAILEEEGYEVICVADGEQALAYLRGNAPPTFILLDLNMPRMNGWDFRQEQLSDPDLSGIPVVVMTGYREYGPAITSLQPAGHLQKPVHADELRGVLGRFR